MYSSRWVPANVAHVRQDVTTAAPGRSRHRVVRLRIALSLIIGLVSVALLACETVTAPSNSFAATGLRPAASMAGTGQLCTRLPPPAGGGPTNMGTFIVFNPSCALATGTGYITATGATFGACQVPAGTFGICQAFGDRGMICFQPGGACFAGPPGDIASHPIPVYIWSPPAPSPPCTPHDETYTTSTGATVVIHNVCRPRFLIRANSAVMGDRG